MHVSMNLISQPSIQWQKCLGGTQFEAPYDIQATMDGGCIGVGVSLSSDGDVGGNFGTNDVWVVKLDSLGQLVWQTNLGGSKDERGYAILVTDDNGILVAGFTESNDFQVSGNHGNKDCWVVSLDANGVLLWQKCFGGGNSDTVYGICKSFDGGYIIAAESSSSDGYLPNTLGGGDFWIFKIDPMGQLLWSKIYGGTQYDRPYGVSMSSDGFIYVTGETSSVDGDITLPKGGLDIWVIKLDPSDGSLVWQKSLGGSGYDVGLDVGFTTNGEILILGSVYSNNGDVTGHHGGMDFWIVALNQEGDLLWQNAFGGSGDDAAQSMEVVDDSGILIFGTTSSTNGDVIGNDGGFDFWLLKITQPGGLLWQKTLGVTLDETGYEMAELIDEGIALIGRTRSNNGDVSGNQGSSDFWIVKLSPETSSTSTPTAIPLRLYPNPASNWITLNLPITEQGMQVSITDELGKQVLSRTIRTDEKLDISVLGVGVYWVSAVSASGQVYAGKFVKAID
ncbi:MAG TPA: hypothetical protein DCF33_08500 [Saprospirales bacterium]|nr:hypothetical protein [Saprospirales bacterium]